MRLKNKIIGLQHPPLDCLFKVTDIGTRLFLLTKWYNTYADSEMDLESFLDKDVVEIMIEDIGMYRFQATVIANAHEFYRTRLNVNKDQANNIVKRVHKPICVIVGIAKLGITSFYPFFVILWI